MSHKGPCDTHNQLHAGGCLHLAEGFLIHPLLHHGYNIVEQKGMNPQKEKRVSGMRLSLDCAAKKYKKSTALKTN
jgi:hypothetical protein